MVVFRTGVRLPQKQPTRRQPRKSPISFHNPIISPTRDNLQDQRPARTLYDWDICASWAEQKEYANGVLVNFVDRHHIIPRSRGGRIEWSNIIHLWRDKHTAWHRLFVVETLPETILRLRQIERAGAGAFLQQSFDWKLVFKHRTIAQAAAVLERVLRRKNPQVFAIVEHVKKLEIQQLVISTTPLLAKAA